MQSIELASLVAKYLEDANKIYDSEEKAVKVVTGFLPDNISTVKRQEYCPRIIVRPAETTDENVDFIGGVSKIKLYITFLTYEEIDEDAYLLIYNWIEKNRVALLKHRHFKDARMVLPMNTRVLEESLQPKPMWIGVIEATYETESVKEEGLIIDDYGYE